MAGKGKTLVLIKYRLMIRPPRSCVLRLGCSEAQERLDTHVVRRAFIACLQLQIRVEQLLSCETELVLFIKPCRRDWGF